MWDSMVDDSDAVVSGTYDEIVTMTSAAFKANGAQAAFSHAKVGVSSTKAYVLRGSSVLSVPFTPGTYRIMSIRLTDAIDVACMKKGDIAGLAALAGMTSKIEQGVRDEVERTVLQEFAAKGAKAYVLR